VYDHTGRLLQQQQLGEQSAGEHTYQISLQGYSSGMYYYRLNNESGAVAGSVIKE
jgi:hypothetical protein